MEDQSGLNITVTKAVSTPDKKVSFADVTVGIDFAGGKHSTYDLSLFSSNSNLDQFLHNGTNMIKNSMASDLPRLARLTFSGETSGASILKEGTFLHFKYESHEDEQKLTRKVTEKYFLNFEGQERDAIVTVKASDIKIDSEKDKSKGKNKDGAEIYYFANTIDYKLQIPSEKLEVTFNLNAKTGEISAINSRAMDSNDMLKAANDMGKLRAHDIFKDSDITLTGGGNPEKPLLSPSLISTDKYFDDKYRDKFIQSDYKIK